MSDQPKVSGQRSPRWAFMARMTIPCENGLKYLTRLRIIQTPWFGVYLHNLYEPDADRDMHDHPWEFISIILRGGYTEIVNPIPHVMDTPAYNFKRRWNRWSWHKMSTDKAHRILSVDDGTISLILVGRRKRSWGFYTPEGWVDWREYERAEGV